MFIVISIQCSISVQVGIYIRSRIVTLHMRVCQRSVIGDHQQKIGGKCQGLSSPNRFVIDFFLLVYKNNVGESSYSISS